MTYSPQDSLDIFMKQSVLATPFRTAYMVATSSSENFLKHFFLCFLMIFFSIFASVSETQVSKLSPRRASDISLGRVSISAWIVSSTGSPSLSIQPSSENIHISQEYLSSSSWMTASAVGQPFPFPFPFPPSPLRSSDLSELPSPRTCMAALDLSPMSVSAMHIIIIFSPSIHMPSFCLLGFPLLGLFLLGFLLSTTETARVMTTRTSRNFIIRTFLVPH